MKKKIALMMLCVPMMVQAQRIDEVLRSIEQNNKELQSQTELLKAQKMENRVVNNLSDPVLSYGVDHTNGVANPNKHTYGVSQSFDFPTQYITRVKQADLKNMSLDYERQAVRRDILLKAKQTCLDLVRLNQVGKLMQLRMKYAQELEKLYAERLNSGDVNILEVNKIKMERMVIQTAVAENNAAHRQALQQLLAMNGNLPLEFSDLDYPEVKAIHDFNVLRDQVIPADYELKSASALTEAAKKQVSVNKQDWLPKLQASYSHSNEKFQHSNAFTIGASLPLFSNRKKVNIAKAQAISAQLQYENELLEVENQLMAQFNEMQQLKESLDVYDVPLMYKTLDLLKEALKEGQISLIDYFVEAQSVYGNLEAHMEVENKYQKVMAAIYKNNL